MMPSEIDEPEPIPGASEPIPVEYSVSPDASSEENPDTGSGLLDRRIGDRPLIVYLAMLAGLGVLMLLLGVVWMSATGGGEADQPICLDISRPDAESRILAGDVNKIDVLTDEQQPVEGLTLIQLEFDNDECAKLPEGADNRDDLYEVLGLVTHVNETGDQRIDIEYTYKDVPAELLATSTPAPSETPEASVTVTPEEESTPTPTRQPTRQPTEQSNSVAAPTVRAGAATPTP